MMNQANEQVNSIFEDFNKNLQKSIVSINKFKEAFEEVSSKMNRERENELFDVEEFKGLKNTFTSFDEEFVKEYQRKLDLEITVWFLEEIGYSKEQISLILMGPKADVELEDYCKKDMITIEEAFVGTNRSSRRHPNMNFEETRYRRHKKGEKYYG